MHGMMKEITVNLNGRRVWGGGVSGTPTSPFPTSVCFVMQNPDIARLFDEVADLLEIKDENPFRVRAYRNAARVVRDYPRPLADEVRDGADLTEIPGIGEDLAEKIATIVTHGRAPAAPAAPGEAARRPARPAAHPRPRPQTRQAAVLRSSRCKSAADLEKALDAEARCSKLTGFGPKMEQNIRAGLGQALHVERRLLLPDAETHAQALVAYLQAGGGITNLEVAGSYRRRRETIGDLDVLATRRAPRAGHRAVRRVPGRREGRLARRDARHGAAARRAAGGPAGGRAGGLRRRAALLHRLQGAQRGAAPDRPGPSSTS